jgi:hypothetical protein
MLMKVKTVLLLTCFVILFCSQIEASAVVVSIPDTKAGAKEVVEVPVMVDDASGIAGFNFDITYDASALQALGVKKGSLTTGWMITPNITTAGKIKVAGFNMLLSGLSGGKGSLAVLRFKVIDNSKGNSSLAFNICKLSDSKGVSINSTPVPGKIRISHKK